MADTATTPGQPDGGPVRNRPSFGLEVPWGGSSPTLRRFFSFAFIVFILAPLVTLLSNQPVDVDRTVGLGGWVAFVCLFVLWLAPGRAVGARPMAFRWIAVIGMTLVAATLGLISSPFNWLTLFFFAAVAASRLRPSRYGLVAIWVVALLTIVVIDVRTADLGDAILEGFSVGLVGFMVYGVGILQRTNAELTDARHEVARLAVADERMRIARDLHDTLGQSLSLITLKTELARRLIATDPARAEAELRDVEHASRDALASVRETVSGYRQPRLASELAGARIAMTAAGIVPEVEGDPAGLPSNVDALLAWAVREGATNVIRHSRAGHSTIRIEREPGTAGVEIVDDGPAEGAGVGASEPVAAVAVALPAGPRTVGGAAAAAESAVGDGSGSSAGSTAASTVASSGLRGLAERISAAGGHLEAGPLPGRGFRLHATVPMPLPAAMPAAAR